ncbi:unnamed protein product [Soboliphyme baturini]|uniref:WAP domain-containing protein n=1 Tax=Soboliphyme baturini TaxID=241478 RepID=A0A183IIW8_9BILA|nr:unnamed protein product [Soboliphyme baturini]
MVNDRILCIVILHVLLNIADQQETVSSSCPAMPRGVQPISSNNECNRNSDCSQGRICCPTLIGKMCMLAETSRRSSYIQPPPVPQHLAPSYRPQYQQGTKPAGPDSNVLPPPQSCTMENEEPSKCAPVCPLGCDNMYQGPKCYDCKPGCSCKYGYYRLTSSDVHSPCVSDVMCLQLSQNKNCPDGATPLGTCKEYNNQCPARYLCQNDLCCPGPKPGSCPLIPNMETVMESLKCTGDGQCEGNKKCCATSEGGRCLTPLPTFGQAESSNNIFGGSRIGQTVGKVASLLGFGDLLSNIGQQ